MNKILKTIFLTILSVLILGIIYFLSKWNNINIEKNIGKSTEIKNLDKKVFDHSFVIFDSTKVKTDFDLFENKNDTVTFNFSAYKSPKFSSVTLLTFSSGDGYVGVNINVVKYKTFCYSSAESYTDNIRVFDFLEPKRYVVKKQKITFDKSEYKKGDSIFGKIELEIKFRPTDSIFYSKGYFRSIVE